MRVLAIDPGGKRLGVALGDTHTGVASPIRVVRCAGRAEAVSRIVAAATELDADLVVLGLPTGADGRETGGCRRSRALAEDLARAGLDVALQPEHLSTAEARRRAAALGRRPAAAVDDLAAQIILEDYLADASRSGDRA